MKRGISTVEVVTGLVFVLFAVVAIVTLCYGYSFADALFIQPAVTRSKADAAIGEGWLLKEACYYRDDCHRYIYVRDGKIRDVHCKLVGGDWSTVVKDFNF